MGHRCRVLHGDIQQKQRETTLQAFKEGRFSCLVATDVAARGLHIDNVHLVVQLQPPKDVETFVHRSGRTGRAGAEGTNIVFFAFQDTPFLRSIEKSTGIKFKRVGIPQSIDIIKASAARLVKTLVLQSGQEGNGKKPGKNANNNASPASDIETCLKPVATQLVNDIGAVGAVCKLLYQLMARSNSSSGSPVFLSALTGREGFKAYEAVFDGKELIAQKSYIWKALRQALGNQADLVEKVKGVGKGVGGV